MKKIFTILIFLFLNSSNIYGQLTMNDIVESPKNFGELTDEKIEELTNEINNNPTNYNLYSQRGFHYSSIGEYKKAIEDFNLAIKLNKDDDYSFYERGKAKLKLNDLVNAFIDFNNAININIKNKDNYNLRIAYLARAEAFEETKQYEKSVIDYTNITNIAPDDADAFFNRARIKMLLKKYDESIIDFEHSIKLSSFVKYNALCHIGLAYFKLEKYRIAFDYYIQAIEFESESTLAYEFRAQSKIELKDYLGSLADFDKIISINDKDGEAYFNRGLVNIILRNFENGCSDFSKAGELGITEAYNKIANYCK